MKNGIAILFISWFQKIVLVTLFSWQCDLFLLLLNYISFSCKNVNHINSNDDDVYAEQKLIEWSKKA